MNSELHLSSMRFGKLTLTALVSGVTLFVLVCSFHHFSIHAVGYAQAAALFGIAAAILQSSILYSVKIHTHPEPQPQVVASIQRKRRRKRRRQASGEKVPAEVRELIQCLRSGPDGEKAGAAKALGNLGSQALPALNALCEGLESPFPAVRSWSAWAIMKIGPEARRAAAALYRSLQDEEDSVRSWSALALVIIREETLVAQLIALLNHANPSLRCLGAQTLARLGTDAQAALGPLRSLLDDDDAEVRAAAAAAVQDIEPNES